MESLICNNCESKQELENNFCGKCGNQLKCLSCSGIITAGANFCSKCGADVKSKKQQSTIANIFELNETKDSRTIKAEFSDNMGSNMTETLAQLVTKKFEHKQLANGMNGNLNDEKETAENVIDIKGEVIDENKVQNSYPKKSSDVESLFKEKDGRLNLLVTDLKATARYDYALRLTYLIVLFYKSKGEDDVAKSVINGLLNYFGVNDGTFRTKFANSKAHFMVDSGKVEFRPAGLEQANVYLKEVLDNNKQGSWKLSDLTSNSAKKKPVNTQKGKKTQRNGDKKTKSSSQTIKLVSDLNLYPSNKKSLKDFYTEFNVKTNYERNLLFTHYITKVLGINECGLSHIYTCYKELNQRVPAALYQSLKDTQTDKGWIDTKDIDKIIVPTKGENAITHDLKRK